MNVGGWGDEPDPATDGVVGEADAQAAMAFLDAYLEGASLPDGPLSTENDTVYLHGWWPVAILLQAGVYMVRRDPDPAGLSLPALVTERLGDRGLRGCAVDDRLLESIALQRVGLLDASWEIWAADDDTAAEAVAAAAIG